MGLLDKVMEQIGGKAQGGDKQNKLLSAALGLLSNPAIVGLGGLISRFQSKGLGDVASSWIGKGENKPIQPEQMEEAIGPDKIDEIATQTGLSHEETSQGLSKILPDVVDKMTPDGNMPDPGSEGKSLSGIRKMFGL